jgi:hypothetical protein
MNNEVKGIKVDSKVVFGPGTNANVRGQHGVVREIEAPWHTLQVLTGPLAGTTVRVNGDDLPQHNAFASDHSNPKLAGHKATAAVVDGPDGPEKVAPEPPVYVIEVLTGPDEGKTTRLHATDFSVDKGAGFLR